MANYENNSSKNRINDDMDYVDIHGRKIRVVVSEKTGEILIPINEIRQTGFNIYHRNQYSKALIDDRQLIREFEMYLLDCAKNYILKNKVIFDEAQILQSIDKCRQALISNKTNNSNNNNNNNNSSNSNEISNSQDNFFKNRVIQTNSEEETFQIQIKSDHNSSSLTQKNLRTHNKRYSGGGGGDGHTVISSTIKQSPINKNYEQSNRSYNNENFIVSPKSLNNDGKNHKQHPTFTLRSPKCNKEELLSLNDSNCSSENGTIKSKDIKSTAVLEVSKVYSVIVTFIEPKGTLAWVQDIKNTHILAKIFDEVHEQAKNQSPVKPCLGKIYAALDEGDWYRCKVVKLIPLTVLFIDYGNTVEINEVRPISDDLVKIPQQAIRISFNNAILKLEEEVDIIPTNRYDDGTHTVQINKQRNFPRQPLNQQNFPRQPLNQQKIENNMVINEYFDLPKPVEKLSHNTLVKIYKFQNNKLTLRSKDSYVLHNEICQKLSDLKLEPLKNVKINQIILYKNDNDNCVYRVRVLEDINKDSVRIDYLDYYNEDIIPKTSIFAITEELSKYPLAYIPIEHFENGIKKPLNIQQENCINNHIEKRTKFTAEIIDNKFDLKYSVTPEQKVSLFDELDQFVKTKNITTLKHLKQIELELGKGHFMCSSLLDFNVTIIKDLENILNVMKTTVDSDSPYKPEKGEVCLGLFEDNWFRCVVNSIQNDQYCVRFIDYGNLCTLKPNELRQITDEMKELPILGYQAKFVGLPDQLKKQLSQSIVDGEIYEIDIKHYNDGVYEIEIPEIYEQILF